jgi:hypothetical protein
LGDFFTAAAKARPINPKQIKFTAVAKGGTLPNGQPNPHGVPVGTEVVAALVFLGGDGYESARTEARKALAERGPHAEQDFWLELTYQIVRRAVREWDPAERKLGGLLFSSVQECRDLVEWQEADRIVAAYNAYVAEEHPGDPDASGRVEGVDLRTFRGAEGRG